MGIDKELLHNTLSIQSKSQKTGRMQKYLKRFAKKHDILFENDGGNIYMIKGDAETYPCVVAHTDTVHEIIDNFVVTSKNGIYQGKNRDTGAIHGVGGDDKVGIAIALQALLTFPVMKAAFFRDEEQGCIGSRRANMTFFDDCTLVIQVDRRGNDEVTSSIMGTPMISEEFSTALLPFMETHGFKFCSGMMTDVWQLRERGLGVCAFNMSAGYHNPHTSAETVVVADVDKAWGFVYNVVSTLGEKVWPFEYIPESKFSLWEEEEDDSYGAGFEHLPMRRSRRERRVGMHAPGWNEDCPICGGARLSYDETLELNFCMDCCEYVVVPDDEDDFIFEDEEEDIDDEFVEFENFLSNFVDGHGNALTDKNKERIIHHSWTL